MKSFAEIAFTPKVRALQSADGSRDNYARMERMGAHEHALGDRVREFLLAADSFYLASVSESGWPYVQHRGGPRGFLKVIDASRIAFADYRGNRQFVSVGNTLHNDRVALIVMDYVHRRRLKILGRMTFIDLNDADTNLAEAAATPGYDGRAERIAVIEVEALDWNCPQHITQRFAAEDVEAAIEPLQQRILALEAELRKKNEIQTA